MAIAVEYTSADDWCALYVDGKVYYQGHSVPVFVWLEVLALNVPVTDYSERGYEYIEAHGSFPNLWAMFTVDSEES